MFKVLRSLARAGLALFFVSELLASPGPRASAPYFDNFDSYPSGSLPANFTGSHADGWTISNPSGISGRYLSSASSTPVPDYAYSVINLANVPGRDFTVSTRFTAAAFGHGPILDASVGLIALSSSFAPVFDAGQGLTMSLHGQYAGGTLFLTAAVSNGISAIVFHGTDISPPNGPYFGYWDRVSGTATAFAQMSTSYDDFAVTFTPSPTRVGNISRRLADPIAELHDENGAVLASNDSRREERPVEIEATGLAPPNIN
jgi:hypothetical protein